MTWERLAEARIREWLARPPGERPAAPPDAPGAPLEVQLMADVRVLDRMAGAAADPAEARRLRQAADHLMIRLSVLLEREGRPLAAQAFAARRAG